MKTKLSCVAPLLTATVFLVTVSQGAMLPGSENEVEQFVDLSYLSSPNWGSQDIASGVPKSVLDHTTIPKFLNGFLRQFHLLGDPVQTNEILDDLFEGVSNDHCKGHILEWIRRFNNSDVNLFSDEEQWVLQMVDSWGKLPEGILSGHINFWGDFEECVDIEVKNLQLLNTEFTDISQNFEGRYCTAYVVDYTTSMAVAGRLPVTSAQGKNVLISQTGPGIRKAVSLKELVKVIFTQGGMSFLFPSVALCMPNSCTQSDIHVFFANALFMAYNNTPKVDPKLMPYPLVATCGEKAKPDFTAGDIAMIVILSAFVAVSLGSGIVDYWQRHRKGNDGQVEHGKLYQYFMAFSFYTNTKKWLSTRRSPEDLGCLHGIRFFSMSWVVLCHGYSSFGMVAQWNNVDIKMLHEVWTMMPILNGTFSVDTFFVMSGFLATYNILKMLDKSNGKFNVIMFYVHRYIRLTPTYAILVGLMATLILHMGNGPNWIIMDMQAQYCKDNWWTNLLYINNLVNIKEMCNGESWYLANDMQFYILSPLIVYPLWKWPKPGLALLLLYTIASCISPALIVHYTDAFPAALMTRVITDGFFEIYMRPWARIQTFLNGIWLGWLLYKTRGKRVHLPPVAVAGLWLSSTILALVLIYSIQDWFDPSYEIPKVPGYLYAALSRFSWGLVISWVIFACIKGYGGIVNTFLSWKVFMPLGRLTFCVYLVSMHLQMLLHSRISIPWKYDTYTMVNLFFAHMVVSLLVGFLCTMLFESPFIILQKLIFEGGAPKGKPQLRTKKTDDGGESVKDPSKRHGVFYENRDVIINPTMPPSK